MPRILCVWFPLWPIQRLRSVQPEVRRRPLALFEATARGERLTVCSPLASRQGLRRGMSRAEAETLAGPPAVGRSGRVLLFPADPDADRDCLHQLALWCRERFSPMTAIEDTETPECLLLDIEGCGHLFGGEQSLVRTVVRFFRERDWRVRCALAGTLGGAWAIARAAERSIVVVPAGQMEIFLRPLPVVSLRLPEVAVRTLLELGIERVSQLLALPRAELASRFEPLVLQRIRQALGLEPELIVPVREPEPIMARWCSEDTVGDQATLEFLCRQLIGDLLEACRNRGLALVECRCRLEADGPRHEIFSIELVRPTEDAGHVLGLLVLKWEQHPFPESIHTIVMEAARTTLRTASTGQLFDDGRLQTDRRASGRLIERLTSRLGKTAVLRAALHPDAQPEFAITYQSWIEGPSEKPALSKRSSRSGVAPKNLSGRGSSLQSGESLPALPWERPLTLREPSRLTVWSVVPDGPPQRVQWRQQMQSVVRWWGPERIETGWWRGTQCHRDYYRVELETGEWLWIFRNEEEGWSLHGVFD